MKKTCLILFQVLILLCFVFHAAAEETAASWQSFDVILPATAQRALEKYPVPFDVTNVPRITSYTEENGLVTVEIGGDVEALIEELGGSKAVGNVYYSIQFGYTFNGESLFDKKELRPNARTAQYQLPKSAVFQNRFSLQCSFSSISLSISASETDYTLAFVEVGANQNYDFSNSDALISLYVPVGSGIASYRTVYHETTGALTQYSYSLKNVHGFLSATFDADQHLTECMFMDENDDLHRWNSTLGWYDYGLDETTNQYVQQPVDGPAGADVNALLPLTIE